MGTNGAGKSTLLSCVSGLIRATGGTVEFAGEDVTGLRAEAISGRGLVQVPEGRRLFRGLTIRENLDLGLWRRGLTSAEEQERLDFVLGLFPFLCDRLTARAEVLSGGEQQMAVIAQALMGRPRMLLIDEPSVGLAPVIVDRVFASVREMREAGMTVLLVDQVVTRTLGAADRAYVMQTGRIVADGPAAELRDGPEIRRAYPGAAAATD
ncbi:ABC transporter ATP-binding protein [Streptomyces sp. NPDC055078]